MSINGKTLWLCEEHEDCMVIHEYEGCPVCALQEDRDELYSERDELQSILDNREDASDG